MTFFLLAQTVHDFQIHCECIVNIIVIINLEQQFMKIKGLVWHSHVSQQTCVWTEHCQTGCNQGIVEPIGIVMSDLCFFFSSQILPLPQTNRQNNQSAFCKRKKNSLRRHLYASPKASICNPGERRGLPCCEIPTRWHGMRAPLSPGQGSWATREPLSLFPSSRHDHMMLSGSTGRFTKCCFLKTRGLQHCDLLSRYCHTTGTVEWGTPQFLLRLA